MKVKGKRRPRRRRAPASKPAAKRSASSRRWLERQRRDPYVAQARQRGYRSRAAFKLIELDARFGLLGRGKRVVDLGAAPGGWTQVAARAAGPKGCVVAIDKEAMDPVPGATVLRADFLEPGIPARIAEALGGPADVVLSDMAPPATGHAATDHLRLMALTEAALDFAVEALAPGGVFVAKARQGGTEAHLLGRIKGLFASVRHAKPPASRADSAEVYVVARGFRGKGR